MKRFLAAVLVVSAGASMLYAERMPDWVNGRSKKYPQSTYLAGVGLGADLDSARSAARAEVAKVFKARVTQSARDTNSERSLTGAKSSGASLAESLQETSVSTDEVLAGVEIAETWYDKKKKTCYALALLDKPKLRAALADEIAGIEADIRNKSSLADGASSTVDRLRALTAALKLWDRKEELLARKRVVDPSPAADLPSGASRAELESRRDRAKGSILFKVSEDDGTGIGETISDRISAGGFGVLSPGAEAKAENGRTVITVKYRVEIARTERGNPQWKFYRWQAGADMAETKAGGISFAALSRQGESSALSDGAAQSKALMDAGQALAGAVEEQIRRTILGEE